MAHIPAQGSSRYPASDTPAAYERCANSMSHERQKPAEVGSLNRRQETAITALLNSPTLKAAAEAAGVSERSLRDWQRLPQFAAAYAQARAAVHAATIDALHAAGITVVGVLLEIAKNEKAPAAARVASAREFELSFKGKELVEFEQRLTKVERQAAEVEAKP